ncbi:MAG: hypothetical protein ACREBD_40245 [Blastocatellia bacterium]
MKQKRFSLVIGAVVIAAITLLTASSTARTRATTPPAQSTNDQLMALMSAMNVQLEANDTDYRVDRAEYITSDDSGEVGQTVFFNDRTKQLGLHFVPGDPRRGGRTDITYRVDQTEGAIDGLTVAQTTAAIDRAMATWQNVNCSVIPITRLPNLAFDIGLIEFLNGLGGAPIIAGDIVHAGWLPAGILPNGVIAATFTFIFVSGGVPTDIDNNGQPDVALREILYNNFFLWRINANIDVETVALHEAGHGLSQGHFGKAFVTNSNGKLHFAPRAVMNAAYSGVQQNIKGTDNGGHCSIWGSWPNN